MAVGSCIKGVTYNRAGDVILPNCKVRLYDRDTGVLVGEATSNGVGEYGFGAAPQNYFVTAYREDDGTVGISQGSHVGSVSFETAVFHLEGEILDANTDLIKIKLPAATAVTVHYFNVISTGVISKSARFEIRNAVNGGGSCIKAIINSGDSSGYGVGNLTTTDFYWIRSIFPGAGLYGLNFEIWFTYP